MTAAERLLRYVQFDTQSNEFSDTCPSTDKQKVLALSLVEEMKAMGISDAYMDAEGYVYGTVPGDPTTAKRISLSTASSPTWIPPLTPPGPTFRPESFPTRAETLC